MNEYKKLASDIIKNVGGKENVISLRHCVTRLRFKLKDESKANDEAIKNTEGVITVMKAMGEYMVVIGEHVPFVFKEVNSQLGISITDAKADVETPEKKPNVLKRVLAIITGSTGPVISYMCACGILKGILSILSLVGLPTTSGVYMLLNAAADCFFYFMPLMLGFNAAKKLDMDPFMGLIIAAALCYPSLQGAEVIIAGHVFKATYTSTFLPIMFAVAIAAPLYKMLRKIIPQAIRSFTVPLIVLLIVFPITFTVIGPVSTLISEGLANVVNTVMGVSPLITGVLFAGIYQVLVIFGVHGLILTVDFINLMQGVPSLLMALTHFLCFSQVGVIAAIYLKTKDKKLKSTALPAMISGVFGVTEPAIYGVTLPRPKMFAISLIGGASAGAVIVLTGLRKYVFAGMGVAGLFGMINPENPKFFPIILATLVPLVVSFVLGFMFYKDDDEVKAVEKKNDDKTSKVKNEVIVSPVNGVAKPLSTSSDDAFAMEQLGKGILLLPDKGEIFAPCNGVIRTLFPTKHAIGIVSDNGCEILIHIGMNTVSLDGKYFVAHVNQGDTVKQGQLLISFEKESIENEGYSTETPVVITNSSDYLDIVEMANGSVKVADELITVIM